MQRNFNSSAPGALVCAAVGALALPSWSQTIVGDGEFLQGVIDASPSGTVIEIHSNETFIGQLAWENKDLVLRAGPGFAPVIQGSDGAPAFALAGPSLSGSSTGGATVARLEGLTILRGTPSDLGSPGFTVTPPAFKLNGGGELSAERSCVLEVTDCAVVGDFVHADAAAIWGLNPIAPFDFDGLFEDSTIEGDFLLEPGLNDDLELVVKRCVIEGNLRLEPLGSWVAAQAPVANVRVHDSVLAGDSDASTSEHVVRALGPHGLARLEIRRTRVVGQVVASTASPGAAATTVLVVDSSIVEPLPSSSTGIAVARPAGTFGTVVARVVNATITGFDVGLDFDPGTSASAENMLLVGNLDDVGPQTPAGAVVNSLVGDGSLDGVDGNFSAVPTLDCNLALAPGSAGIDAGNSLAVELGPLDVDGQPRILDGDGDGTPRVNVGAQEALAGPLAAAIVANGSGVNPLALTATALPVLGSALVLDFVPGPGTAATVVAIGFPAPVPLPSPFGAGELLVNPSPAPLLDLSTPFVPHVLAVPADPALSGVVLFAQGFRIVALWTTVIEPVNGLVLTLGEC